MDNPPWICPLSFLFIFSVIFLFASKHTEFWILDNFSFFFGTGPRHSSPSHLACTAYLGPLLDTSLEPLGINLGVTSLGVTSQADFSKGELAGTGTAQPRRADEVTDLQLLPPSLPAQPSPLGNHSTNLHSQDIGSAFCFQNVLHSLILKVFPKV